MLYIQARLRFRVVDAASAEIDKELTWSGTAHGQKQSLSFALELPRILAGGIGNSRGIQAGTRKGGFCLSGKRLCDETAADDHAFGPSLTSSSQDRPEIIPANLLDRCPVAETLNCASPPDSGTTPAPADWPAHRCS